MQIQKYKHSIFQITVVCSFISVLAIAAILAFLNFHGFGYLYAGILVVTFLLMQAYNVYHDNHFHCPKCKSICVMANEEMSDKTKTWVQNRFYCKKCDIAWDTGRVNINPIN